MDVDIILVKFLFLSTIVRKKLIIQIHNFSNMMLKINRTLLEKNMEEYKANKIDVIIKPDRQNHDSAVKIYLTAESCDNIYIKT